MRESGPGGYLAEIFFSLQGEGPAAGRPELFLRLAGCSLGCPWCDTKGAWKKEDRFFCSGRGWEPNPVLPGRVLRLAESLTPGSGAWVTLTGGEPLEQEEFTLALLRLLAGKGFRCHLETAGVHADVLDRALPFLEALSLDWKLPSLSGRDFREGHRACLRAASSWPGRPVLKIVVGPSVPKEEIDQALEEGRRLCPSLVPVLQPLTPPGGRGPEPETLEVCLQAAKRWAPAFPDLRVLPQIHRLLGLP